MSLLAKKSGRIYFLDELRGLALIGMIVYHTAYDLRYLFGLRFDFYARGWNILQAAVCSTFIIIAGISSRLCKNALKHGAIVLGAGILMSLGTYFFMPEEMIWFGVLHFLGVSIILYYAFPRSINKAAAFSMAIVSLLIFFATAGLSRGTILFGKISVPSWFYVTNVLAPLGLPAPDFSSADYFPLIPWFFLFLFGSFIGKYFKERNIPDFMMKKHSSFLSAIGSNTLIIYIVHQPVIYGLLTALFWVIEKGTAV